MSDSEELPRKTSKGFCSDSLSLPDDAEEDEAEEEAFLLALGSLATFSQRQPTLCTKFAPRHNEGPRNDPKWPPRHNASPLCSQNSHGATTGDHVTIQNGHRATTPAHFVHKFAPRHNGRPRYDPK